MQVKPGPCDSPAVVILSAIGAEGYGRGSVVTGDVDRVVLAAGRDERHPDRQNDMTEGLQFRRDRAREPEVERRLAVRDPGDRALAHHDRRAAPGLQVRALRPAA